MTKTTTRAIALFAALALLSACEPTKPTPVKAKELVEKMQFLRHPNGHCIGVIEFVTYSGYMGTSITHVPCSVVK
jgi:hypothetical protein